MSYAGPAVVADVPVHLRGAGWWEPIDGRYHWVGRIRPEPRIAALVRAGRRDVSVIVDGRSAPARLGEVDPWGGVRITGTGRPPWPVDADDPAPLPAPPPGA